MGGSLSDLSRIVKFFLFYKAIQILVIYFTPGQFDNSSIIIIDEYENDKIQFVKSLTSHLSLPHYFIDFLVHVLQKLVVWDAVYFTKMFSKGISFEHEFVFCPLWWRIILAIPIGGSNFYFKLLWSVALGNLFHMLSCFVLYFYTKRVFGFNNLSSSKTRDVAFTSSVIYVIAPAGVFLTAPYAESGCALSSFVAMYLREISLNRHNFNVKSKTSLRGAMIYRFTYLLSGTVAALGLGFRANSILLGILFLYDLFEFGLLNKLYSDACCSILAGTQIFCAFIYFNWYAYSVFCPQRGEWCKSYFPSIFSYAQHHYWGVGFFRYWTPNNIPNFIFAAPTIVLTVQAMKFFFTDYPFKSALPLSIMNAALLIGGLFWWHVQILTRISCSMPLLYWYLAVLYTSSYKRYKDTSVYILYYFILWGIVQTGLFAAFLPPA